MWYKKAMDLNDLNREFALERENVIDAVEEENTKQDVEDLFEKVRSGEQYTSPSGAIKVNHPVEIPPMRNQDIDGSFNSNTSDYDEMHQIISGAANDVQSFIDLSKTLERYIPVDSAFTTEMESIKSFFDNLEKYVSDILKREERNNPKMKQYVSTQTPEEQEEIRRHNSEVISFFNTYEPPRLDENVSNEVNRNFIRMTKLINEMAPKIMSRDGKTEWLNLMAKKGTGANFLPNNLRAQYLKIMQSRYGGY
jgi:hypothetical protein